MYTTPILPFRKIPKKTPILPDRHTHTHTQDTTFHLYTSFHSHIHTHKHIPPVLPCTHSHTRTPSHVHTHTQLASLYTHTPHPSTCPHAHTHTRTLRPPHRTHHTPPKQQPPPLCSPLHSCPQEDFYRQSAGLPWRTPMPPGPSSQSPSLRAHLAFKKSWGRRVLPGGQAQLGCHSWNPPHSSLPGLPTWLQLTAGVF